MSFAQFLGFLVRDTIGSEIGHKQWQLEALGNLDHIVDVVAGFGIHRVWIKYLAALAVARVPNPPQHRLILTHLGTIREINHRQ